MHFRVLGPLEVLGRGGEQLTLGSPRQRAVLGVLLTEANRVVAVDRLLELLWRGEPPGQANATLQTYISGLRRVLEPDRPPRARPTVLVTRAPGYSIVVDEGALDAVEFERLAAEGRAMLERDPRRAAELLEQALALWRGDPYADFADEPWAFPERTRLEELRLGCVEDHFEAQLALGDHAAIVSELAGHVDLHPLRERPRGQLMLTLYRSGRQVEALRTFEDLRTRLVEELGLEPGPELRRLERAILEHDEMLAGVISPPRAEPPAPLLAPTPAGSWEPQFIGRHRELDAARGAIAAAASGRGSRVVIEGEPGSGKSRLLAEVASEVQRQGGVVLSGRGVAGEAGPPLWPWPELVRDALAELQDGSRVRAVAAELGVWASPGEREPVELSSPALARRRLFENVALLLSDLAGVRGPVLLAIDDLHRCGDDALELLASVARGSDRVPLLVVVALPTPGTGVRTTVGRTLATLSAAGRCARLTLGNFERGEIASCLEATTGTTPGDELVDRVLARTGGNPFFTVEVGRLLAAGVRELGAIPESVRDVVRDRLARLPLATVRVLEVAAVAGPRFDLGIIARAADRPIADAAAALEPAEATGIVVADDEAGAYRFSHGIVAEVVTAGLGRLPQARLNDALATAMAERWEGEPARAAEIAEHAASALPVGSPARALEWLSLAARSATQALALGEAERFHRRRVEAAGFLDAGPEAWRIELAARAELAVLLTWRRGQSGREVGTELTRAMQLAQRLGDAQAAARTAWGLWTHHSVRGELVRAAEIAESLRDLGRDAKDPMYQVLGEVAAGATAYQQGRHADARRALDRAREGLGVVEERGLGDELVQHPGVHRAVFDAMVRWFLGDEDGGTAAMRDAVDAASSLGHPYTEQFARSFATVFACLRDDVDEALDLSEQLLRVTREQGFALTATIAATILGWARARNGDAEGIRQLQEALAERGDLEANVGRPAMLSQLADALLHHGRAEEALRACDDGLAAAAASSERYWDAELHRRRALALAALGRGEEASAAQQAALATAKAQGTPTLLRRAEREIAAGSGS